MRRVARERARIAGGCDCRPHLGRRSVLECALEELTRLAALLFLERVQLAIESPVEEPGLLRRELLRSEHPLSKDRPGAPDVGPFVRAGRLGRNYGMTTAPPGLRSGALHVQAQPG